MRRESAFLHKCREMRNRFQQLLLAVAALYTFGCHVGDVFYQTVEVRARRAPEIRFGFNGFFHELEPVGIESVGHLLKYIGGIGCPSIRGNLLLPNPQERQEIGFTRSMGTLLSQPVSEQAAANTAANAPAKKAHDYRCYVWHLIAGVAGGAFGGVVGAFGYLLYAGEIDLPKFRLRRRSKSTSLEKRYRIGGNTR
jgi:hypothetical protein